MKIYPRLYCNNVLEVTPEILKENNIKALILDVDNTLLDFDLKIIDGLEDWGKTMKENEIKCIILSNSNKSKNGCRFIRNRIYKICYETFKKRI